MRKKAALIQLSFLLLGPTSSYAGFISFCERLFRKTPPPESVALPLDHPIGTMSFNVKGAPYALNFEIPNETGWLGFHPAPASIWGIRYSSPSPVPLHRVEVDLSFVQKRNLGTPIRIVTFVPFRFSEHSKTSISPDDLQNLNLVVKKYVTVQETQEGFDLAFPVFKIKDGKELFSIDTYHYAVTKQPSQYDPDTTLNMIEISNSESRGFESPSELISFVEH